MRRLLAVYRHRCDHAAATLLLLVLSHLVSHRWGWVGVGFVDISLVGVGVGLAGKRRNGGKRDETVFWGDTKPGASGVVCGAAGWRKRVD
eukprot:scaffold25409_cov37-Attheya_sp.AAC.1